MTRKRRTILATLALVSAVIGVWAVAFRADPGRMAIIVETIRDEEGAFQRRWTFTSGRRWASYGTGFRAGEHFVVLDPPGSFDSRAVRFLKGITNQGANQIVYEIEATRSPGPGPTGVIIKRSLRGNAGGTPAFSNTMTIPLPAGPWRSEFQADSAAALTPVPTKVRLGLVGGLAEVIEFR